MRIIRVVDSKGVISYFSDRAVFMESLRMTYSECGVVMDVGFSCVLVRFNSTKRVDVFGVSVGEVVTSSRHL